MELEMALALLLCPRHCVYTLESMYSNLWSLSEHAGLLALWLQPGSPDISSSVAGLPRPNLGLCTTFVFHQASSKLCDVMESELGMR